MAVIKLINLLALSTLAILATSFGATPVTALATDRHDLSARHIVRGHDSIAKRKRAAATQRCKQRPSAASSAAPPPPTSSAAPSPTAAPAPSSSSSQAPAPSSSPSTNNGNAGNGKVGIAWPNGDAPGLSNFKSSKTSYLYTWAPDLPSNLQGFQGVPMLWGWNQVDDFKSKVVAGYANVVLGMNEPNEAGQSNMSPQSGAQLWQQYIQPLKSQGYRLISPATSSNPNGMTWMNSFFQSCQGCTVDAMALHFYDTSSQGFIDYVNLWHTTFNHNIWVTEFACENYNGGAQADSSDVFNFMQTVTSFMDNQPWVEVYFAFGVMHDMQGVNTLNQLMGSNNQPTALGSMYLNGN